jgi:hypothetical protein
VSNSISTPSYFGDTNIPTKDFVVFSVITEGSALGLLTSPSSQHVVPNHALIRHICTLIRVPLSTSATIHVYQVYLY